MASRINPDTRALLAFIRQHQPVRTYDAFSLFEGAGEHFKAFSSRVSKLGAQGYLVNSGKTAKGLWSVTPKTSALLDEPVAASPWHQAGAPVPPRQVNVMHTPVYQPAPATHYRAGAFDFAACPSLTAGHPTPFTGATS
jgi:hypothetical protein